MKISVRKLLFCVFFIFCQQLFGSTPKNVFTEKVLDEIENYLSPKDKMHFKVIKKNLRDTSVYKISNIVVFKKGNETVLLKEISRKPLKFKIADKTFGPVDLKKIYNSIKPSKLKTASIYTSFFPNAFAQESENNNYAFLYSAVQAKVDQCHKQGWENMDRGISSLSNFFVDSLLVNLDGMPTSCEDLCSFTIVGECLEYGDGKMISPNLKKSKIKEGVDYIRHLNSSDIKCTKKGFAYHSRLRSYNVKCSENSCSVGIDEEFERSMTARDFHIRKQDFLSTLKSSLPITSVLSPQDFNFSIKTNTIKLTESGKNKLTTTDRRIIEAYNLPKSEELAALKNYEMDNLELKNEDLAINGGYLSYAHLAIAECCKDSQCRDQYFDTFKTNLIPAGHIKQ